VVLYVLFCCTKSCTAAQLARVGFGFLMIADCGRRPAVFPAISSQRCHKSQVTSTSVMSSLERREHRGTEGRGHRKTNADIKQRGRTQSSTLQIFLFNERVSWLASLESWFILLIASLIDAVICDVVGSLEREHIICKSCEIHAPSVPLTPVCITLLIAISPSFSCG
jgi:hypothetical protein